MNGLETVWTQPVARALGGALAGFVWQGATIALVVRTLLACMERRPARERYALACLGLLAMAVLPMASFWSALASVASGVSPSSPLVGASVLTGTPEVTFAAWMGAWLETLRPWLLSAWLCGVLLLSLRTGMAWRHAQALTREGTRPPEAHVVGALARMMERTRVSRPVRLLESVAIEVPMVVGLWRPLILVPASTLAGLSVSQLEAVLAHELAHIRRHDYLVNLLQALVETALFYHPAVWWLSERIREEREHCADDVAVECCGDALLYSRALATLEQLRVGVPVPAVAANGGSLLLRIQRLLAVPEGGAPLHPWRLAGGLAAALLVVVLGAARQAQATGATSEPPVQEEAAAALASYEIPSFQEGIMTRPMKLSGDPPRLPESMLPPLAPPDLFPRRMYVECTLTAEGIPTGCTVIDPRPEAAELEVETLRVLHGSRFEPVTYRGHPGHPLSVRYVFNLRFSAPVP